MKQKSQIWSIYGQIEEIVARAMIVENKANQLPLGAVPETQLRNDQGEPIRLAVVIGGMHGHEFEERIRNLRS